MRWTVGLALVVLGGCTLQFKIEVLPNGILGNGTSTRPSSQTAGAGHKLQAGAPGAGMAEGDFVLPLDGGTDLFLAPREVDRR